MRTVLTVLAALAFSGLAAHSAGTQAGAPAKPADVTGQWTMAFDVQGTTASPTLDLKQDGEKLTGRYIGRYGSFALTGTVKSRAVAFAFTMAAEGTEVPARFAGELSADGQTLKGDGEIAGLGELSWTATRKRAGG